MEEERRIGIEGKVLKNPELYIGEHNYFPNLTNILIKLHSLPFEINKKMNSYLTVADSLKISYFKEEIYLMLQKTKKCKYHVIFNIGHKMNIKLKISEKEEILTLNEGTLLLIDSEMEYGY